MAILLEELLLPDAAAWRAWLDEHHDSHPGVRLVLHKKGGTTTELTYAQAVDEALCFGWIDGQRSARDEHTHYNRFTPRTARSKWSTRNVANVERLAGLGLMAPSGIAAVDAAKADGRWDAAYEGQATATLPEDFLESLAGHPLALQKLETLSATERYAIYYRLHAVKGAETRRKKIADYVARLDAGRGIF
ncbi:YdeI family protein [Paeniglutamicibacter sp. MACA_103]|uniref:YdeI/OmpD-associated family protein n=1 Tax=Paeniglutamicibacter sp. MACA_103 TaxID=3377337 RepID=UPI00389452F7